MQAIALGTHAAYPGPGNACTGWLVVEGETRVLIDCGPGILSHLQRFYPLNSLTAVFISHMHADHFLDLLPLRYAYKYGLEPAPEPVAVYLPPNGEELLRNMVAPLHSESDYDYFKDVFKLTEYSPTKPLEIAPFTLTFAPTTHYVPAWAVSIQSDRRLVYTADTAPCQTVAELAKGADLLITEATYLSVNEEGGGRRGHSNGAGGRRAGRLRAGGAYPHHSHVAAPGPEPYPRPCPTSLLRLPGDGASGHSLRRLTPLFRLKAPVQVDKHIS